jgi:RimJ/RimL family protein N-acetyltransferase
MGVYRGIELDEVGLTGPRIRLRPWRSDDAGDVYEALQPEGMTRYLAVPSPYSRANADEFVTEASHQSRTAGTGLEVAIVELETDRVLGSAAIRLPFGQLQSADIGYWVAPWAQGQGYAAEAVRVLADWVLDAGIARAEVRCEPTNLASARTALSAGHAFEGYHRDEIEIGGLPRDTAVFVRTRDDGHLPVPAAFPTLPTAGLSDGVIMLRPIMPADRAQIIELETDERTVEVGFSGVASDDDELARMCDRAALDWFVGQVARMSIVDVATGSIAGNMQLRKVGPPSIAGVGYGVHPAFRGRGYTARALRLLAAWAFADGGIARLELGAKQDNVASQRAAASGGFVPDGVRRARLRNPDGTFSDEVRFALVAPQFR